MAKKPDYRLIHQLEVELGFEPYQPYGYAQLAECENIEELVAAWKQIEEEEEL